MKLEMQVIAGLIIAVLLAVGISMWGSHYMNLQREAALAKTRAGVLTTTSQGVADGTRIDQAQATTNAALAQGRETFHVIPARQNDELLPRYGRTWRSMVWPRLPRSCYHVARVQGETIVSLVIIRKDGKPVSTSKNLRGILRYTMRERIRNGYTRQAGFSVVRVHVLETPDGALLRVRWSDGAYAVASFASCTTCRRWCQARKNWPMHRYTPLHYWHAPTRAD